MNQPTKQTRSQELSRNKNKKNLKKNIPCSLHLFNKLFVLFCFLAFPAIKQIYTLIYTAHQQSWLKQFCAAGMKRQTHPPYTRPSKKQPTNTLLLCFQWFSWQFHEHWRRNWSHTNPEKVSDSCLEHCVSKSQSNLVATETATPDVCRLSEAFLPNTSSKDVCYFFFLVLHELSSSLAKTSFRHFV